MQVLYEDNHLIIVSKAAGEIVQGDKTGDTPLSDIVKAYIKEHYAKPGQVFLGVTHRLDRPVSGVVVFARTSKALSQMNILFRLNKSFSSPVEKPGAKLARLRYRLVASTDNYHLLAVRLLTGRHHQIRCQLASIGCPIKGDLKYGARRSNPDGSISLHAWRVAFEHPVSHKQIVVTAPCPDDSLWRALAKSLDEIADFS